MRSQRLSVLPLHLSPLINLSTSPINGLNSSPDLRCYYPEEMSFLTPKTTVQHIPSHTVVSDTPFIPPSAWLTGPVDFLAEGELDLPQDSSVGDKDVKEEKKSRKSRREGRDEDKHSKKRQVSPSLDMRPTVKSDMKSAPAHVKPPVEAQATSGLEVVQQPKTKPIPVHTVSSNPEQKEYFLPGTTGQGTSHPGSSGEDLPVAQPSSSLFGDSAVTGAYCTPPAPVSCRSTRLPISTCLAPG